MIRQASAYFVFAAQAGREGEQENRKWGKMDFPGGINKHVRLLQDMDGVLDTHPLRQIECRKKYSLVSGVLHAPALQVQKFS